MTDFQSAIKLVPQFRVVLTNSHYYILVFFYKIQFNSPWTFVVCLSLFCACTYYLQLWVDNIIWFRFRCWQGTIKEYSFPLWIKIFLCMFFIFSFFWKNQATLEKSAIFSVRWFFWKKPLVITLCKFLQSYSRIVSLLHNQKTFPDITRAIKFITLHLCICKNLTIAYDRQSSSVIHITKYPLNEEKYSIIINQYRF